jgi:hypothetical protein
MTQGVPIPVVYGKHAVGGIRIAYDILMTDAVDFDRLDTNGDNKKDILLIGRKTNYSGKPIGKFAQPLQDWLLLCEGEIESVEEVYLNEIPYTSLPVMELAYAPGTSENKEEDIIWIKSETVPFDNSKEDPGYPVPQKTFFPLGITLSKGDTFTYVSRYPSKLVKEFRINLFFPSGLWKIQGDGYEPCKFKITLYRGKIKIGETEEIQLYGQLKDPFVFKYAITICKNPECENGNSPTFHYWQFYDPAPNEEPYKLVIEKTTDDNPTIYDVNLVKIQGITELLTKPDDIYAYEIIGLTYPHTAFLYYYVNASAQLSGTLPNVKAIVKGRRVKVWNFEVGQWEMAWTDNPAWIIRDILTNPRYGLGDFITEENIDNESFKAFAQFCEEQGYRCNLVLDGFQRGWDLINNLLAKFRAFILRNGSRYKIKFLKDESPIQMFTMGNIIQGSLKVHFISISDRYNTIEARFLDKTDGYKMKTILVSTGEKYERKKTIDFFGITDRATVEKECKFLLSWMQKVKRSIEFDVYLEALAIEPGDIFLFSHDVPKWLQSGRIVSQESNIIILDRKVDSATTYLKTRTKNDEIKTYTVETVNGSTIKLAEIPTEDLSECPYICGTTTEQPKLYRCIEITRTAENIRHVVAIEHIPELYD